MNTEELKREVKFYISHARDRSVALREIETFYVYVISPNEINRQAWIHEKLLREARKYEKKGISKDRWPPSLQGLLQEQIDDPLWYYGPRNARKESNQLIEPKIMKRDMPQLPVEDIEEEKSELRGHDPFHSDGFGTLLGEPSEPRGLGNRRR